MTHQRARSVKKVSGSAPSHHHILGPRFVASAVEVRWWRRGRPWGSAPLHDFALRGRLACAPSSTRPSGRLQPREQFSGQSAKSWKPSPLPCQLACNQTRFLASWHTCSGGSPVGTVLTACKSRQGDKVVIEELAGHSKKPPRSTLLLLGQPNAATGRKI